MSRAGRGKRTSGKHVAGKPATAKHATATAAARPARAAELPVLALAALGMLVTLYLTLIAWSGDAPALCAPGSGCDVVQGSRWSTVLGLPVALWGFAVYALIAVIAWRMRPGLKRWRRLWNLALLGVGISVYLTVVGIVSLDAVCGWCLASLAAISAIFATVALRRPVSAPGMPWTHWGINSALVLLVSTGLLHAYYSGVFQQREHPRLQALATHLADTGARYYGAFWCGACQEQRRHFGASADRLPYIECSPRGRGGPSATACVVADIGSYPTWVIDGQRIEGVLTPDELARLSGFAP
jgi:uncharacterized membrane protein